MMFLGSGVQARRRLIRSAVLGLAAAAALPVNGQAAGIDGPGSYYMFRSFDTGQPFTPEQKKACADHFGPVRAPTALELSAGLFSFTGEPETGRVVDQKAGYLGPAIACLAPAVDPDPLEIFAAAWPPSSPIAGISTAAGPCATTPAPTQPGALLLNCKIQTRPDPGGRIVGGLGTSNSVVNPRNAVPGAPTGSIWTVYVVTADGGPLPPPPAGQVPQAPAPSPGLDFYAFRTFGDTTAGNSPSCPGSLLAQVVGVRSSALHATAPALADGKLPQGLGPQRGAVTVCFTSAGQSSRSATARLELTRAGRVIHVVAGGDCRDLPTPAGSALRQQACNLTVQSSSDPQIRGGLMTSNGLVGAGTPLAAANSHIWTVALFAS